MIVSPKEIKHIRIGENQRVGLTSGCFDLLHFYHYHYLVRCKAECDVLIVGVDSDDLVKRNKDRFPAVPEYHRAQMLAALRCVDAVFVMRNLDDFKMAAKSAQAIFKNSPNIYGEPVVGLDNAELVIVEDVAEVMSTTQLKAKIVADADLPKECDRLSPSNIGTALAAELIVKLLKKGTPETPPESV